MAGLWWIRENNKIYRYIINTASAKDYSTDTFKQFIKVITGPKSVGSEIKDLLALVKLLEMRVATEHPKFADSLQVIYKNIPFKYLIFVIKWKNNNFNGDRDMVCA